MVIARGNLASSMENLNKPDRPYFGGNVNIGFILDDMDRLRVMQTIPKYLCIIYKNRSSIFIYIVNKR